MRLGDADPGGIGENGLVSQVDPTGHPAAAVGKRLRGADWVLIFGVLLTVFGLIEIMQIAHTSESGPARFGDRPFLPEDQAVPIRAVLLTLAGTAPVALLRPWLLPAATVVTGANYLMLATTFRPTVAAMIAEVAVTYAVARYRSRRALFLCLLPFAAYVVIPVGGRPDSQGIASGILITLLIVAVCGGLLRERADARQRRLAEAQVAGSAFEHAARGERARIARELHDVVAHHISMISVQAETARLTTPGLPTEGARRLLAIGDTAREALTEMRRLLGVLREDAGASRSPQPGLADLAGLLDETRDASGASTRLILRGHVVPLEPGIELAAYRIVQEALTNARRHAPGSAVDVELNYARDGLYVVVRDNGPGAPDGLDTQGLGLLGIRERAMMAGGSVQVGTGRHGGFQVRAVLPMRREAT
jgi:signal transduction histidine kinase